MRNSKYDPLVDEVELLEANHQYAHVRFPDGRESTVSTHHLAPAVDAVTNDAQHVMQPEAHPTDHQYATDSATAENLGADTQTAESSNVETDNADNIEELDAPMPPLRCSERQRCPPECYGYT